MAHKITVLLVDDHALFRDIHARVLVRAGRPLAAAPRELLDWILREMTMFKSTRRRRASASA